MVFEHQHEYPSQWKAIVAVAEKLGIHHETLRNWVRRAEVDGGLRPGLTSSERDRMRELEREVKELRRANEIVGAGVEAHGGAVHNNVGAVSHQIAPISPVPGHPGGPGARGASSQRRPPTRTTGSGPSAAHRLW
jgi:hypothetical protein